MLGISVGFAGMILIVGLGLAVPLAAMQWLQDATRWIGAAWIACIAWQIATAPPPGEGRPRPPLGFVGAMAFQWINPKAWLLALGMATAWVSPGAPLAPQVAVMAAMFALAGIPSSLFWAMLGEQAGGLLRSPRAVRCFNGAMAVLLVLSMLPVILRG